ncbi:MAG: alkaline phosphatase PhoX [Pseudomonadota bacterium]
MEPSRRYFLKNASVAALAIGAFRHLPSQAQGTNHSNEIKKFGSLIKDPAGILDLPRGFSYKIISRSGEPMSDGLMTPYNPDGMAAFPVRGKPQQSLLIRNHELHSYIKTDSFGGDATWAHKFVGTKAYDFYNRMPANGGTTNLLFDQRTGKVEHSFLSLIGTLVNCSGGVTPWGSWLSCEETQDGLHQGFGKDHGFIFEVPSNAIGLVEANPLTAMGRFKHEACAIDLVTGIVYMTEDDESGLFYRFLPNQQGVLAAGGRLQALVINELPSANTRNWQDDIAKRKATLIPAKKSLSCKWIDLDNVTAPDGDLRKRGRAKGAAIFARGEGLAFAIRSNKRRELFFSATTGGEQKIGQLWRYQPSPYEGTAREQEQPGTLDLFYETADRTVLKAPDNLVIAPWGDLIVCEDSYSTTADDVNYLRGITAEGKIYNIAMNPQQNKGEFCGACFSPDGSTLFINIQTPGMTFAITGPWQDGRT